jgi:hypothetical protein
VGLSRAGGGGARRGPGAAQLDCFRGGSQAGPAPARRRVPYSLGLPRRRRPAARAARQHVSTCVNMAAATARVVCIMRRSYST